MRARLFVVDYLRYATVVVLFSSSYVLNFEMQRISGPFFS